jgi:tRNA pseudouridine55 synthase
MTSHDVVQVIRRVARTRKVGHTGTLDPDATGLLPITIGHCTKLANFLTLDRKGYLFTMRLGAQTTTDDASGEVVRELGWDHVSAEALAEAVAAQVGHRMQRPPRFSAIRVDGRRAYERARAGEEFELEERPVEIEALELREVALPDATLHMSCTAGTYVRSLVRDLGEALGTCAHTTMIRRTRVGPFTLDEATPLDAISPELLPSLLYSPAKMLKSLPALTLSQEEVYEVGYGRAIECPLELEQGAMIALLYPDGGLYAVAAISSDKRAQPKRVLSPVTPSR